MTIESPPSSATRLPLQLGRGHMPLCRRSSERIMDIDTVEPGNIDCDQSSFPIKRPCRPVSIRW
jgi:hypothetical protein